MTSEEALLITNLEELIDLAEGALNDIEHGQIPTYSVSALCSRSKIAENLVASIFISTAKEKSSTA